MSTSGLYVWHIRDCNNYTSEITPFSRPYYLVVGFYFCTCISYCQTSLTLQWDAYIALSSSPIEARRRATQMKLTAAVQRQQRHTWATTHTSTMINTFRHKLFIRRTGCLVHLTAERRGINVFFRRNPTYCISPYAIVVSMFVGMSVCLCLCVCMCVYVCVCVYAAFVDARKTVWDRDVVFF